MNTLIAWTTVMIVSFGLNVSLGMWSLDRPLAELLEELPLTQEIKQALLGEDNRFSPIFNLVLAYEKADWAHLIECIQRLDLDKSEISDLYLQALV